MSRGTDRSPLRLLIPGAHGQVGRALAALAAREGVPTVALSRADLDVTDPAAVDQAVAAQVAGEGPLVVVNAASYTAVDRAESEPAAAFAVNRDGPAHLARACRRHGAALVHLSTDYVFDGESDTPYAEADPAHPLAVYGASKWAGEEAVREALDAHAILRTAWVISARPGNFATTMARLARERDALRVVADQWGHPTPASSVAGAALALARRLGAGEAVGTVHLGGEPATTWHGLAEAIVAGMRERGVRVAERVEPIPTEAYPTAARRPRNGLLNLARARALGLDVPDWRGGLDTILDQICAGIGNGAGPKPPDRDDPSTQSVHDHR